MVIEAIIESELDVDQRDCPGVGWSGHVVITVDSVQWTVCGRQCAVDGV